MDLEIKRQGYDLLSLIVIFAKNICDFNLANREYKTNRTFESKKCVALSVVVLREVIVRAYLECRLLTAQKKFTQQYDEFIKYICEAGDKIYSGMFTKCWLKARSVRDLKELFLVREKSITNMLMEQFWQSEIEFLKSTCSTSAILVEMLADEDILQTILFKIHDFCFRAHTIINPIKWENTMTLPSKKKCKKNIKLQYDVFITYRRSDGLNYAQLLYQALDKRGYNCFLDVRDRQDYDYEERILTALRNAPNYIFILTEGSLQRLSETGNAVYKEIKSALVLNKKIIVVAPSGMSRSLYGANLLDEFNCLRALSVSRLETGEFFEASVDEIVRRFPVKICCIRWSIVVVLTAIMITICCIICELIYRVNL